MPEKYIIEVKRRMVDDTGHETQISQKMNANAPTETTGAIDRSSALRSSVVLVQGARVVSTAFNFATSNYGNITGDSVAQHNIQVGLAVVGEATNLVTSFLVGGVVGGAAALVGTGLKYATQFAQASIESNNRNANISQFNERIGHVIRDGGR